METTKNIEQLDRSMIKDIEDVIGDIEHTIDNPFISCSAAGYLNKVRHQLKVIVSKNKLKKEACETCLWCDTGESRCDICSGAFPSYWEEQHG